MKQNLLALSAILFALQVSTTVLARNNDQSKQQFVIVFIAQISSKGQKAAARVRINKTHIAAVQRLIRRNPLFANGLRMHGVRLTNVVDFDRALDGHLIFYVR